MSTFDHNLLTNLSEKFSGLPHQNWAHIVYRWLIWLKATISFIRMATTIYTPQLLQQYITVPFPPTDLMILTSLMFGYIARAKCYL